MDYVILQWRFAELMHQCRQCVLGQVWQLYLTTTTTAVTWRTKQKQKQQQQNNSPAMQKSIFGIELFSRVKASICCKKINIYLVDDHF